MATDIVKNSIGFFLDSFLSRPASSIPKGAQWAVSFDNLEDRILPAISLAYSYEPGTNLWKTEEAASVILTKEYQETRGCLFCQAIGMPGEGMQANVEGVIQSNAYIRSYVGAGRNAFPIMRMTFVDTHVSFCDSFLRGWTLATANFGMIARPQSATENYRTNMTCYKFGITPEGPFVIQKIEFKGICCINVSEEEYNYAPVSAPVMREAQFVYNSYSVDTVTGNYPKFITKQTPSLVPNLAQSAQATQQAISTTLA